MPFTIITHNAYWFQGCPSVWGRERAMAHPRVLHSLTALYASLHPNLLCLQEVPEKATFDRLARELNMHGLYAPGGIRAVYGGAVLVNDPSATFRNHSSTITPTGRPFERVCIAVRVAFGNRRLLLVNIHLSSNRYLPPDQGERIRLAELDTLFTLYPHPDLVVGDMNATPQSAVYLEMTTRGYVDTGLLGGDLPTTVDGRRLDYIWIHNSLAHLVSESHLADDRKFYLPSTRPPTALSDHRPVVVRLTSET